ncbi:MAG: glyoxalase [Cytophagaceae bacterium]|nr:glyoxalase [Cytophagaceae bacterium]
MTNFLLALRPPIDIEPTTDSAEPIQAGSFQNQTLRPILKGQNEALLAHFRHYLHKRKDTFFRLSEREQLDYIAHTLRTDQKFKNFLVGQIVGWMTAEERSTFLAQEAELTRRTVDLLIQRFQSQRAAVVGRF